MARPPMGFNRERRVVIGRANRRKGVKTPIRCSRQLKGTLLDYCNVNLVEAMAPGRAYMDATQRRDLLDYDAQPVARDMVVGKPSSKS